MTHQTPEMARTEKMVEGEVMGKVLRRKKLQSLQVGEVVVEVGEEVRLRQNRSNQDLEEAAAQESRYSN